MILSLFLRETFEWYTRNRLAFCLFLFFSEHSARRRCPYNGGLFKADLAKQFRSAARVTIITKDCEDNGKCRRRGWRIINDLRRIRVRRPNPVLPFSFYFSARAYDEIAAAIAAAFEAGDSFGHGFRACYGCVRFRFRHCGDGHVFGFVVFVRLCG